MRRKRGHLKVLHLALSLVFLIAVFTFQVSAKEIGAKTDTGIKKEGVTVKHDNNSPTGYTATFVYKNATAKSVQFYGQFAFAKTGEDYPNTNVTTYAAVQWTKDMFPLSSGTYQENMIKVKGTDFWTISIPLPSGGYPYSYVVDGTKISDPANIPIMNQNGGTQTLSMAYIPFDAQKQVTDYSYVLPKNGAKTGSVSFVKYSTKGLLAADQPLGIYLPFGYDANRTEPYKVIYLSHGGGGNEADWFNTGSVANIMDNLIAEKKTEPAIVVTMDNTAFSWNFTNINKNIMENIIPYIEAHYNVSKSAKDRAFAGLSMGALTSSNLYYAHPTDFGYFGIFSGASANVDLSTYDINALRTPKLLVGAGCYDMAYYDLGFNSDKNTLKFLSVLDANKINYSFKLVNGSHDWFTWPQLFYKFAKDIVWK